MTRPRDIRLLFAGAPALIPVVLMLPPISRGHGYFLGNDVLGLGSALLLFAALSVTPLRTLTKKQWFVPLRRWYGVMFAVTALVGGTIDSIAPGGPVTGLVSKAALLTGTLMTLILVPLLVMGIWNKWSMKQLGKYWKSIQKYGTYTVWGLLGFHMLLLGQEVAEFLACSFAMLILRVPLVRQDIREQQSRKRMWEVALVLWVPVTAFLAGYAFFAVALFGKGIPALTS